MKYPYTPEVLDALPESVAELFRQVEDNVLEGICTKLEAARYLSRITVPDLKKLRDVSNKDIEQMIQEATGKGETKIQSIMSEVVTQNTRFYSDMQAQMGLTSFKPILTGTVTTAIQQQTLDTYQNLSGSMGFLVDSGRTMLKPAKAYQWAIDNAIIQIQSGAMNYEQAIRYAVRTLAKSGIKTVSYESGKIDQMDVAVRRAVLTGANQLCLKFAEKAMDSLYTDLVEVSAHVGARNNGFEPENHEMWQGKVYRWSEKPRLSSGSYPDFIRHTGYGSGEGLGGWNCRHSFHAFVEGVSERTYTDDELDSMRAENRTFEYEGKEYDGYTATQKQRQIERTLRKLKRERSSYRAAGLTDEYNAVNAKIRRLTYKYRQFSKKAGLPEQRERTKVQYTDDSMLDYAKDRADTMEQVRDDIRNGKYSLVLNPEKQARHMANTAIQGRSVITVPIDELQDIVNSNAGHGHLWLTGDNKWTQKEMVDTGRVVGYTVNKNGDIMTTTKIKIHYSKTGVHVVPYSGGR